MLRLGFALAIGGLFLMFWGGRSIYEAAVAGSQKTMGYTQFVQQRPGIGWYRINDAGWDLGDCLYVSKGETDATSTVETVFIPVHAAGTQLSPTDKVVLVLETDRKDLCNLLTQVDHGNKAAANSADAKLIHYEGPLDGTIVFGGDMGGDDREKMAQKFGTRLDAKYVVLQDGNKPSGWKGLAALLGGIVLTPLGVFVLFGRAIRNRR